MVKHSQKCLHTVCLAPIWIFEFLKEVEFWLTLLFFNDWIILWSKVAPKIFLGFREKKAFSWWNWRKNQFPNNNVWNWCWLFYAANGLSVQVIDIESPTKRWAVIWHAITDFWLFLPHYLKKKHCFWFEIKNQEKEQKTWSPRYSARCWHANQ